MGSIESTKAAQTMESGGLSHPPEGTPTLVHPPKVKKSKSKSKTSTPVPTTTISQSTKTDDFIMDTNSSSIVSKRSVEKLYYHHQDGQQKEYFRFFVRKFQRRSPLINRGYWLRMKAVDSVIRGFLTNKDATEGSERRTRKIVVNLGCGYDPNPFEYLGRHPELCGDVTFVDVDYPQLMQKKLETIKQNAPLYELFPDLELQPAGSAVIARSEKYLAVGCDLRELDKLESVLRAEFSMAEIPVSILFTAEVSTAYMTLEASNNVFQWASKFDDVRFCLLEQQIPDGRDHPFAQTMLKHFNKLRTPLHAVGTMDEMKQRFSAAGWPATGLNIRSLWELWAYPDFLTPQQRMDLDDVEPFDEWEEFALFGSHYFLMVATKTPGMLKDPLPAKDRGAQSSDPTSEAVYSCLPLQSKPSHRRFGAVISSEDARVNVEKVVIHGGLGTRERLNTCDTYAVATDTPQSKAPPLPVALMCHTTTAIGAGDCLIVGGRASPGKASVACWYRKNSSWNKVHDLPEGRYRHCAIPFSGPDGTTAGVIVFGGKNGRGEVLNDWLMWTQSAGWTKMEATGPAIEPRFGAAMALSYGSSENGVITGGLRRDGTVINDIWTFELRVSADKVVVSLQNQTEEFRNALKEDQWCLGRFGAVLLPTHGKHLLIGGVAADNLLDRRHEILDLDSKRFIEISPDFRPLLTGFSAIDLSSEDLSSRDILVLGGGATCFSFGTNWNDGCALRLGASKEDRTEWHLIDPTEAATASSNAGLTNTPTTRPVSNKAKKEKCNKGKAKAISIPRRSIQNATDFELIRNESRPVVLTGMDIGPCKNLWTNEYLKTQIGESRSVVVHSSSTPHMNFQTKNFSYTTQPFGDFLDAASNGDHLYLRALSAEKPSDKPTNLTEDFPSIADDFKIPESLQYVQHNMHSSPFRVSGPVTMWLHYDVMANILCQICGHKRLLLFSPTEVSKLSFSAGASSSNINPFIDSHSAQAHEAQLQPGDILYIPPLWLHAAEPTKGLSVAVNAFFRDSSMEAGYAAGRDVYGNRDLAAYERGRRDVQKITKAFDGLPVDVRKFYLARLANELKELSKM